MDRLETHGRSPGRKATLRVDSLPRCVRRLCAVNTLTLQPSGKAPQKESTHWRAIRSINTDPPISCRGGKLELKGAGQGGLGNSEEWRCRDASDLGRDGSGAPEKGRK